MQHVLYMYNVCVNFPMLMDNDHFYCSSDCKYFFFNSRNIKSQQHNVCNFFRLLIILVLMSGAINPVGLFLNSLYLCGTDKGIQWNCCFSLYCYFIFSTLEEFECFKNWFHPRIQTFLMLSVNILIYFRSPRELVMLFRLNIFFFSKLYILEIRLNVYVLYHRIYLEHEI